MLRSAVLVIVALALTAPLFAGDIVAMPTGNTVQPGKIELNAIYWNQPNAGPGGNHLEIGEAFFGVVDRLELDVLYAKFKDTISFGPSAQTMDNFTEVNAYFTVVKESPP